MLSQFWVVEEIAFYSVAVFIATIIETPGRALFQILNPVLAKAINENNKSKVANLYKDSSINLLILAGWFFLLVNGSIDSLFELMQDKGYRSGVWVVLMISFAKLISMSSGAANTILINSKKYHVSMLLTIFMAVLVVIGNYIFIPIYGINGAALTTFILVCIFTYIRIGYVYYYFKVQPYGRKTLISFLLIGTIFLVINYIHFKFNPFLSILIKSIIKKELSCH